MKADGSPGWAGGRDLALSAAYPARFCVTVFKLWREHFVLAQPVADNAKDDS